MSKKKLLPLSNPTAAVVAEDHRRWDSLNPEILSLIFVRIIPADEMVRSVPFVCKPWMETVAGPYCWQEIDVQAWCRRRNVRREVEEDLVVRKLIRRSKFTVRRLSAYHLGERGFFLIAHCGRSLKVLEIPMSSINDDMVLKHIKPLPNLKYLDISYCYKITHKGIAAFGNNCKALVRLKRNMLPLMLQDYCSPPPPIDDSEAKAVAATMVGLQRIELCFGRFGDLGVSEIVIRCKSLSHFDIEGSQNVELGGDLMEMCQRLEYFRGPGYDYSDEYVSGSEGGGDEIDSDSASD